MLGLCKPRLAARERARRLLRPKRPRVVAEAVVRHGAARAPSRRMAAIAVAAIAVAAAEHRRRFGRALALLPLLRGLMGIAPRRSPTRVVASSSSSSSTSSFSASSSSSRRARSPARWNTRREAGRPLQEKVDVEVAREAAPGAAVTKIPVPQVTAAPIPPLVAPAARRSSDPAPPDTIGVTAPAGGLGAWFKSLFKKAA